LAIGEIADALTTAVGERGSMADYLFSTVKNLEERGIHDRHLWRLQELVARRIESAASAGTFDNAGREVERLRSDRPVLPIGETGLPNEEVGNHAGDDRGGG